MDNQNEIGVTELREGLDAGSVRLIEVLQPREFDKGHLPGAVNIPFKQVGSEAKKRYAPEETIVVYCHDENCRASDIAADKLRALGFQDVREFRGGKRAWEAAGLNLEY